MNHFPGRQFRYTVYCIFLLAVIIHSRSLFASSNALKIPKTLSENIELSGIKKGFNKVVILQSYSENRQFLYIPFSSFEDIYDIDLRIYDEKKQKFVSFPVRARDYNLPTDEFYTSLHVLEIGIPLKSYFRLEYQLKSSDVMFLDDFSFSSPTPVDTFSFSIRVPEDMNLKYRIVNPQALKSLESELATDGNDSLFSFKGVVPPVPEEEENSRIIYRKCRINMIATPRQFKGIENLYLNNWYMKKASEVPLLNRTSKNIIDSITSGITGRDSIISTLYYFVRDHVKYLAIEVGYGGFIPEDPNLVLSRRQGDCKGKSNLLCCALRYKGIMADLAVTSTTNVDRFMDFPAISNGNHIIARVGNDSSFTFLDPTDVDCDYGHTGITTQGQPAFVFTSNGGCFSKIPVVPSSQNTEEFSFELKQSGDTIGGTLRIKYQGLSKQRLHGYLRTLNKEDKMAGIREWLKSNLKNIRTGKIDYSLNENEIIITAKVTVSSHLFSTIDAADYLSLAFLPAPILLIRENSLPGDILLFHAISKKVSVKLQLEKMARCSETTSLYQQDGYSFSLGLECRDHELSIHYDFSYPEPLIRKSRSDEYSRFRNYLTNTFSNAIRLQ